MQDISDRWWPSFQTLYDALADSLSGPDAELPEASAAPAARCGVAGPCMTAQSLLRAGDAGGVRAAAAARPGRLPGVSPPVVSRERGLLS